jgi:hypothetical protein
LTTINYRGHLQQSHNAFSLISGVEEKLQYILGGNATNNASLVTDFTEEQVHGTTHHDAGEYWLRCIGHVINLAVKVVWFGDVDRTLLQDTVIFTCDTMAECQKMGPWGKAHSITIYVLHLHCDVRNSNDLVEPPSSSETMLHGGILDIQ